MPTLQIENKKEYKLISCIYKLIFNTGYFYIGSTQNLFNRIAVWNNTFSGGKTSGQVKYLKSFIAVADSVSVEILLNNIPYQDLKAVEDKYLQESIGDIKFINRATSAFGNIGIRWTIEERQKVSDTKKKEKKSNETRLIMRGKRGIDRVHKYSVSGEYLCSYSSYKKAALDTGICVRVIAKIINNKKDSHKGVSFRLIKTGTINPILEKIKIKRKKIYIKVEKRKKGKWRNKSKQKAKERYRLLKLSPNHISPIGNSKRIIQYSEDGAFIKEFASITDASKSFGFERTEFNRKIKNTQTLFYKGYIWKYA